MNSQDYEIFYNWNNSLQTNDKIQYRNILAKIKPLVEAGAYNNSEIEEILTAEGFKHKLIVAALEKDSSNESTESIEDKIEAANGLPKKYSDISHRFEKVLIAKGPSKFVKLMTQGDNPLMKLSKKEKDTFQKIADVAFENPLYLQTLHAYMSPSIVSELAENVCKARKIRNKVSISKSKDGTYKITHAGKIIEASIKPIKSSSEKFANSNYETFGFPDEYIILAHEEESPYSKINKDLGL
jgi:hypothetical protein